MGWRKFFPGAIFFMAAVIAIWIAVPELSWAKQCLSRRDGGSDFGRRQVAGYEFIGEGAVAAGTLYKRTEVGGLSGIAYDEKAKRYYAVCDDRGRINAARIYLLAIDLADGRLNSEDIAFTDVITLKDKSGRPFAAGSLDPEGIALDGRGGFYVSSEGDAAASVAPFVNGFHSTGRQYRELSVAKRYLPGANTGIRDNLAFESLTITPDGRFLYTAVENALLQDGPAADLNRSSPARIIKYDLKQGRPAAEYLYPVSAVPEVPEPAHGLRVNGLVELLALDNHGTLLALERAYSAGKGNVVKLYQVSTRSAANLSSRKSILPKNGGVSFEIDAPVRKTELVDFSKVVRTVYNLEGMTFGPVLPDGRQSLIIVGDNNFNPRQPTQFIALALTIKPLPAAKPIVKTPCPGK